MACTYNDDRQFRPHENVVISFNTIGNNSIAHHIPTPKRTPLRKHFAETVDKGEDIATPTIDGYTISDEKYVEARSTRISCNGVLTAVGSMYASHLDAHPLCTKSLTAGSLAVVGDVLAQLIEFGSDLRDSDIMFDRRRIFAMFVEGTFVSGPMLHFVFEFYEYIIPIHCQCEHNDVNLLDNDISEFSGDIDTGAQTDLDYEVSKRQYLAAFLHVAFDQVVMAFPYVAGMMIVTSLIEGHGDLADELEEQFINNVKASWLAALGLAPFQLLSFRYLPMTWRVLAVNLQDVIWVMAMSYVTHRTREASEPFFGADEDDFVSHDDLFSVHNNNSTFGGWGY